MINITADILYRVYGEANSFNKFIEEALQMEALGTSRYKWEEDVRRDWRTVSEKADCINTGIIEIQLVQRVF
jgi:hypothetical protein